MIAIVLIYFTCYLFAMGVIIGVGFVLQRKKERAYIVDEQKIDPSEVVVLVPFRNEVDRISVLLDSIKELSVFPKEFIFIDDHSDDNTAELVQQQLNGIKYSILQCPENSSGKKKALRYGTSQSESKYILTIDADVQLPKDYFVNLSHLAEADMYVLPAIMKAEKWYEHFYEIDLILVTAANAGLAGLARPIMASGANLLYKRETFDVVDNLASHEHAASGDDTYLLRDFRENKTDVRLLSDPNCGIQTETPQSFKEFIDQRLRWIGKTGDIKDNLSTSLALIQAILTVSFLVLLILMLGWSQWKLLIIFFALKSLFDMLLFFPYFKRIKRMASWIYIPIYEVIFPLYTILIAFLLFTYKPKWKGRTIYSKN